jgi:hypothetical protein
MSEEVDFYAMKLVPPPAAEAAGIINPRII